MLLLGGALSLAVSRPAEIPFERHTLDLGASESAAIADIDGDGKLDIVSGENWYQAPKWTKHRFREIHYENQYIDDLSTLPLDVDGDGKVDLVTASWFSKKLAWWKNPGPIGAEWKEEVVQGGYPIEFAFLVDLDNDGDAVEILPQFGDRKAPLAWYERGNGGIVSREVSDHSYGHGIGVGDVNGDGRNDILTPSGWLEAPADPRSANWTYHPDWKLGDVGFIYVVDLHGDGTPAIVTSMAHDYGIFSLEKQADGAWTRRVIDESWSQAHAMTLVDLRGTGTLGLLTGKRYMAHNGGDPGAREPLGLYWYERIRLPGNKVDWAKHVIDYSTRAGGGLQLPAVDIDGDGDRDFVAPGKSGLFLFENKTK